MFSSHMILEHFAQSHTSTDESDSDFQAAIRKNRPFGASKVSFGAPKTRNYRQNRPFGASNSSFGTPKTRNYRQHRPSERKKAKAVVHEQRGERPKRDNRQKRPPNVQSELRSVQNAQLSSKSTLGASKTRNCRQKARAHPHEPRGERTPTNQGGEVSCFLVFSKFE